MSSSADTLPILAVCGLKAEARIAAGPGLTVLAGGGNAARLALLLQASLAGGARAVISFGIAGGLAPGARPGRVIVASGVDDGDAVWRTDSAWSARLAACLPEADVGLLAAGDHAVAGRDGKAALHHRRGALAVDMESHVAARLAAQYGVPFAALRVVADPAERTLPEAALVGMRSDGSTDVPAVLRALLRRPADLPALLRTALDAKAAFTGLMGSRRALCPLFGFGDGMGSAVDALIADGGLALPDAVPERA